MACVTPLVSAIGHEKDSPLLDLVADYRASTPTDAAKRVVPDIAEEVSIPGFRKGKVPMAMLRKQFGPRLIGACTQALGGAPPQALAVFTTSRALPARLLSASGLPSMARASKS